ncbi:hypothetical protein DID88_008498 [Monilinia fructigena]|uniref:Uncharacterized protein n=1 Tax=Monilinia fructigena TaxID=38457 RepID=A0A395J5N5_9HELO|nr:hypothetical protein DID88_008498 [Monilinia fructigena]
MMEDRTMISEGKIRSLTTENEALRLHLKLALESLKNPIKVENTKASSVHNLGVGGEEKLEQVNEGEETAEEDYEQEYTDEDEAIDVGVHEERASEVQGFMGNLLKDLGMFRKKIDDDKGRFGREFGVV